ncbi:caffeoyl-CoA O-methyltransferase [Bacilli bacterium]|nr:caffeoyl-CoA O-methyltransferase [Bacilli bacterium]
MDLLKGEIIKQHCINDNIPLVRDKTIEYICKIINSNQYCNILEIGTAYGYSAYQISLCDCVTKITTIENDEYKHSIAKDYFKNESKIYSIIANCFDYIPTEKYDLIFLDGPKSHQDKLIEKYIEYLNENGTIIIDNIFLNNIRKIQNKTKNQQSLIKKIDNFKVWLENNKTINVEFLNFDDGIAICKKAT